ncbi:Uncharacterised protein [Staphylococcus aureus]|nr:Uncharacterised protein [Staphylococcus aureus]
MIAPVAISNAPKPKIIAIVSNITIPEIGCTTAAILACFKPNLYISFKFLCALSNSRRSVFDILTRRISVRTRPNKPLKFAISDCVLVDIFCIIRPRGIIIKTNIGIVINVNNVIFQSKINNMISDPTNVTIDGNKLGSFCEINSFITFVSSVNRLIN